MLFRSRNPHKYGQSAVANNSTANAVISQSRTLTLTPGSSYTLNEYVYQGAANNATAYGYVYSQSATSAKITQITGTFTVGLSLVGANSGITRTVVRVDEPEFQPYSGDILYTENITKVDREEGQAEDLKVIVRF